MTNQRRTGVKGIIKAILFPGQGLKAAFKNEAAFRQECILTILLAPLGLWLD